jgi:glycosyltransferase involved in cell wall biosynthesis
VRIVIWHGYLLGGTGSNVYTRALSREWSRLGHEVIVVCQDRRPGAYDLGGAHVVTPELPGGLLPVFVLDAYEGLRPKLLQGFTKAELDAYVDANAAAVDELAPDVLFTNHALLGGAVGAAAHTDRWGVKVHGSELEYSMRGRHELERWGAEVLADARAVFVGSEHIRTALEEVVGPVERVHEVPPGVDVELFVPESRELALAQLITEARGDTTGDERQPDAGNAERFAEFFATDEPTVVYVGKLIENKGVQVLLEALAGIDARAVVVGFGDYRRELEGLAPPGTLFTGALEHRHLAHLLPLVDVSVVPSIFPEAFGMVAAEAAAAGVPTVVAAHSGLAEVGAGIAAEYPPALAHLTTFPNRDAGALHDRLEELLRLPPNERAELGLAGRRAVERNWSWTRIAERLLRHL